MNTFEKNYWSLYLDFLHDFKDVTHSGFSIAYFCTYYTLVQATGKHLNETLSDSKFTRQLNNQISDKKEIQYVFNHFIKEHTKKALSKKKKGKIVLHVDNLLRFPKETLNTYFDPSSTLILNQGNSSFENTESVNKRRVNIGSNIRVKKSTTQNQVTKGINNIPMDYLSNYAIDVNNAITQVQRVARNVLKKFPNHPLYGDVKFQQLFLLQLAQIVYWLEATKHFLNTVSVACIVISHPHFINRIIALIAAEKGIPTICMQHGIISGEFGYFPKIATIDAVYGKFEKDWYKRMGASEKSLEIIGHPRFDQAFTQKKLTKTQIYNELGLNKNKKTLMVIVRGSQYMEEWKIFIRSISEKLDLNIVIKDRPKITHHELSKEFPFLYTSQHHNLYDLLPNIDCVVAYSSTVGLEAMLHNKPVFIMTDTFPGYSGYYDGLGELTQQDPKRLAEIVTKYFNDAHFKNQVEGIRKQFLSYAYPDLSSSGERLRRLIDRLIHGQ